MFGGIPYYNRLISVKKSVRENIIDLIASPGARLENEVSMYLNSEISKITNAKKAPINDENNRKKSGYFISDNLSLFYYKYIFRLLSTLSQL